MRVYTDHAGLIPWTFGLLGIISFGAAYDAFSGGRGAFGLGASIGGGVYVLSGIFWLFLLWRRVRDIRRAKREGRDPAIVKIVRRGR